MATRRDYRLTNDKTDEEYGRINQTYDKVRNWAISHLDLSLNWIITYPHRPAYDDIAN